MFTVNKIAVSRSELERTANLFGDAISQNVKKLSVGLKRNYASLPQRRLKATLGKRLQYY